MAPQLGTEQNVGGREQIPEEGMRAGLAASHVGSVASQGSLGQRRRQEAVSLLSAVVDFTVPSPGRVTSLCWVQGSLGWAERLEGLRDQVDTLSATSKPQESWDK